LHAEVARYGASVHRSGAAKRNERKVARIVTALDRDDADTAHNIGMCNAQDACSSVNDFDAQRCRDAFAYCAPRRLRIQ
jgi:hypothetical protein